MTLWRVSTYPTLGGEGGVFAPGRWHHKGLRISYCAPNPATALLEVFVHLEWDEEDVPDNLQYLEIDVPDDIPIEQVQDLPPDWAVRQDLTQDIGDTWLRSLRSPLLQVPSVIVPKTWNLLLNPEHPDAQRVRIAEIIKHPLDARLRRDH